jgi:hypothetical protein
MLYSRHPPKIRWETMGICGTLRGKIGIAPTKVNKIGGVNNGAFEMKKENT